MLAFYLLLVIVARGPAAATTMIDSDEAAFWLAGREVLRGNLPYVTLFDIKPVGVSLLLAGALSLFGDHLYSVRLLGAICVWTTAASLWRISTTFGLGRPAAVAAGVLYIAFSTTCHGLATMTEIMLAPFTAGGVLAVTYAVKARSAAASGAYAFLSGALFGAAALIKLVPVIPGGLVVATTLIVGLLAARIRLQRAILIGFSCLLGLAILIGSPVLVYAYYGQFDLFYFANFGFSKTYRSDARPLWSNIKIAWRIVMTLWPLILLPVVALASQVRSRDRQAADHAAIAVLTAWAIGELVAVFAPGHFYSHYVLMVMPPLSVLAGLGLQNAVAATGLGRDRVLATGALSVLLLGFPASRVAMDHMPEMIGDGQDVWRRTSTSILRQSAGAPEHILILNQHLLFVPAYARARLASPYAPVHLVGDQAYILRGGSASELRRALVRRPQFIVVDTAEPLAAWADKELSPVLQCCYSATEAVHDHSFVDPLVRRSIDIAIYRRNADLASNAHLTLHAGGAASSRRIQAPNGAVP